MEKISESRSVFLRLKEILNFIAQFKLFHYIFCMIQVKDVMRIYFYFCSLIFHKMVENQSFIPQNKLLET